MFTIEHDFDASVITLVDEGAPYLQEDVVVEIYEDCIVVQQHDPITDLAAVPRSGSGVELAGRQLSVGTYGQKTRLRDC